MLPFDGMVIKRIAKMMVPFYVIYVVSFIACLVLSPFFDPGRPPSEVYGGLRPAAALYALADFLGLSYALGTPMLNETWWYMSVAIAFVFLTPLLCWVMKRFGATTILGVMFFASLCLDPAAPGMLGKMGWYLFTLAVGCWCAMTGYFERVEACLDANWKRAAFVVGMLVLFCAVAVVRAATGSRFYWLTEAVMAVSAASFVVALGGLKLNLLRPMAFLGIHSMDIYLIHTFFRKYFLTDFVYSAHNFLLIGLLLLAISLAASCFLDLVRKLIKEQRLIAAYERLLCRLVGCLSRAGKHSSVGRL